VDDLILYVGAFLIGSIPFGYGLVKIFKKTDLRTKGAGHTGVTNVWKVAGAPLGLLTLILDILKGAAAVSLAHTLSPADQPDWILAGFLALVADEFPVFLKFKGGRGIGTAVGVFAALLFWRTVK
jgi:glycerol-3-phosphate acyltransferase PlsY